MMRAAASVRPTTREVPKGPSARQRRLRARQRLGQAVVPVTVSNEIIATLLELGWLLERESESREHIGQAIALMLSDLAGAKTP